MSVFDLNNLITEQPIAAPKSLILVVDDDPLCLKLTCALLSEHFAVIQAPSAERAVELIENLPTDMWLEVAICDQQLPPAGGAMLLRQLQSLNADTLGILLCSTIGESSPEPESHARIFKVLHKPVDPHQFIDVLNQAVMTYKKRREMIKQSDSLTLEIQEISELLAEKKLTLQRLLDDIAKLGSASPDQ